MKRLQLVAATALMLAGRLAYADNCTVSIEADDMMHYSVKEITVSSICHDIEVTLKHSGRLEAMVMGHDWVLAKSSDVPGILNAALAAGSKHGYLPEGDKRIIAATKLVGGGESATVKFSTSVLHPHESYTFFCTTPGHATIMRGRFNLATQEVASRETRGGK